MRNTISKLLGGKQVVLIYGISESLLTRAGKVNCPCVYLLVEIIGTESLPSIFVSCDKSRWERVINM